MNLEEAITKYELQFDKFNTESQGKLDVVQITERLRQMNPRDYIVVNPFSTVDEIYEILRAVGTAYEISIEYLTIPQKWNGPLDMDCVIGLESGKTRAATFYKPGFRVRVNEEDIKSPLEKIGLVGGQEGLVIITKGRDDGDKHETNFSAKIPYFRIHSHPFSQISPSEPDMNCILSSASSFPYSKQTPVESMISLRREMKPDDLRILSGPLQDVIKDDYGVVYSTPQDVGFMIESGLIELVMHKNIALGIPVDVRSIKYYDPETEKLRGITNVREAITNLQSNKLTYSLELKDGQEIVRFYDVRK